MTLGVFRCCFASALSLCALQTGVRQLLYDAPLFMIVCLLPSLAAVLGLGWREVDRCWAGGHASAISM